MSIVGSALRGFGKALGKKTGKSTSKFVKRRITVGGTPLNTKEKTVLGIFPFVGKIGKKTSKISDKTVGNITMGAIGAGVVGAGELTKRKKKKPVRGQNKYGPKGGNKYP
jgi:hypothetical protein